MPSLASLEVKNRLRRSTPALERSPGNNKSWNKPRGGVKFAHKATGEEQIEPAMADMIKVKHRGGAKHELLWHFEARSNL